MTRRRYGQFCGIARALELVGERWALLIVRDLLGGPRRYSELQKGLRTIPTNVLASRLREMEESGVIQREVAPLPSSGVLYALTPYGRELEDVLLRLGRWGALSLPKPGYVDPSIRALRASFKPDRAGDLSARYELWFGQFVIHAMVDAGSVTVDQGSITNPDLKIDVRGSIIPVLSRDISIEGALATNRIEITGDRDLLVRFIDIFETPNGRTIRGNQEEAGS
jgi:DNA-binding HxlR family transcriptional regulator